MLQIHSDKQWHHVSFINQHMKCSPACYWWIFKTAWDEENPFCFSKLDMWKSLFSQSWRWGKSVLCLKATAYSPTVRTAGCGPSGLLHVAEWSPSGLVHSHKCWTWLAAPQYPHATKESVRDDGKGDEDESNDWQKKCINTVTIFELRQQTWCCEISHVGAECSHCKQKLVSPVFQHTSQQRVTFSMDKSHYKG